MILTLVHSILVYIRSNNGHFFKVKTPPKSHWSYTNESIFLLPFCEFLSITFTWRHSWIQVTAILPQYTEHKTSFYHCSGKFGPSVITSADVQKILVLSFLVLPNPYTVQCSMIFITDLWWKHITLYIHVKARTEYFPTVKQYNISVCLSNCRVDNWFYTFKK